MFPRQKRLQRASFPTALQHSRRLSSMHFTLVIPETANDIRGYAIVVPKKIIRLSVTRHRVKRQISAALKALFIAGQTFPSALIVFSRSSLSGVHYQDMKKELADLVSRAQS